MRKRTIRNGMRLVLNALLLIIFASYFLGYLGDVLAMSLSAQARLYQAAIFLAAGLGGYGVVQATFGFVLPTDPRDAGVKIMPVFLMITAAVFLFFYLLSATLHNPRAPHEEQLRPGETITI